MTHTALMFAASPWALVFFIAVLALLFFGPPFFLALEEAADRRDTEAWAADDEGRPPDERSLTA